MSGRCCQPLDDLQLQHDVQAVYSRVLPNQLQYQRRADVVWQVADKTQLGRIVPVHEVHDLTVDGPSVERELALFKVSGEGNDRIEALRLAEIFRANVVDSTLSSFVFEITGTPEKIDAFADLMRPVGLVELARTGVAALARGTT